MMHHSKHTAALKRTILWVAMLLSLATPVSAQAALAVPSMPTLNPTTVWQELSNTLHTLSAVFKSFIPSMPASVAAPTAAPVEETAPQQLVVVSTPTPAPTVSTTQTLTRSDVEQIVTSLKPQTDDQVDQNSLNHQIDAWMLVVRGLIANGGSTGYVANPAVAALGNSSGGGTVINNYAISQRIDKLDGVTITNSSINGASDFSSLGSLDGIGSWFTPTQNFGVNTSATSTPISALAGIFASSTSQFAAANFFDIITSTATGASTFPYASTTALTVSGTASTTNLIVSSAGGSAGCATFSANGTISNTGTACGSGSGTFSWTPTTNFGATANSTSTPIWFTNGIQASSTSQFANLFVSGSYEKKDANGYFTFATRAADAGNYGMYFDSTNGDIEWWTNSTRRLSLTSIGSLGLGSTSPWGQLSVTNTGAGPSFVVEDSTSPDTTPFIIDVSGNVGIGTTSPSKTLSVHGNSYLAGGLYVADSQGTYVVGSNGTAMVIDFRGSANDYGLIMRSHNGGTTPGVRFQDNETGVGSITWTSSATSYTTTSDRRIKNNITSTTLSLDTLMNLPVREFSFTADETHATTTGFIAQELYEIFPWAVTTNGDNGIDPLTGSSTPWSVDYGRITPLIVKAVQDLNLNLLTVASTTASSTPASQSFAEQFFTNLFARVTQWLADAGNGITKIFAKEVQTDKLCVGSVCVTEEQFMALVTASGQGSSAPTPAPAAPAPEASASSTPETPAPEEAAPTAIEAQPAEEASTPAPAEAPVENSSPQEEAPVETPAPAEAAPEPAVEAPSEAPAAAAI